MAIAETKTQPIEQKSAEPRYYVVPTYHGWFEEKKFIVEVELPGISKESIKIKALPDYFTLLAQRDQIGYKLNLDLYFNIEPSQIKANYHEGLLRLEFPLVDPIEKALEVKIE